MTHLCPRTIEHIIWRYEKTPKCKTMVDRLKRDLRHLLMHNEIKFSDVVKQKHVAGKVNLQHAVFRPQTKQRRKWWQIFK